MPTIPRATLTRLRNIDLVTLAENFTDLTPRGKEYKGLCPFPDHNDSNASFSVNKYKNQFYCHGCRKGGGTIQFIQAMYSMDFSSAAKYLGDQHGIPVDESGNADELYEILEIVTSVYQEMLDDETRSYLYGRGLSEEAIKEFRIGLAPFNGNYSEFTNLLTGHPLCNGGTITPDTLCQAGVSVRSDSGEVIDRYRNRVVWPIQNIQGKVISIAGRILGDSKKGAKYINGPDSPVFDKSRVLFNLHRAEPSAVHEGQVILFEDYVSVFVSWTHGLKNCVSGMGTAQSDFLARACHRTSRGNVVICYDPDRAGDLAAMKMSTNMMIAGINSKIARIQEEDVDPDEFIIKNGVLALCDVISNAVDPTDFIGQYLAQSFDMTNPNEQLRAAETLSGIVEGFNDQVGKLITQSAIKKAAGIDIDIPKTKQQASEFKNPTFSDLTTIEIELFSCLLQYPEEVGEAMALIRPEGMSPTAQLIFNIVNSAVAWEEISPDLKMVLEYLANIPIKGEPIEIVEEAGSFLNIQAAQVSLKSMTDLLNPESRVTNEYIELFNEQLRQAKS